MVTWGTNPVRLGGDWSSSGFRKIETLRIPPHSCSFVRTLRRLQPSLSYRNCIYVAAAGARSIFRILNMQTEATFRLVNSILMRPA